MSSVRVILYFPENPKSVTRVLGVLTQRLKKKKKNGCLIKRSCFIISLRDLHFVSGRFDEVDVSLFPEPPGVFHERHGERSEGRDSEDFLEGEDDPKKSGTRLLLTKSHSLRNPREGS